MIAFGRWLQINFFFNTRVHSWKVINKLLQDCSTYIVNCMLQSSVWDKKKKTSRCFPWDRRLVICNEQTAVETDFSQSTGGAVVIALTSHECDLGANTRPQVVMVSSVLLVLASALFFFFLLRFSSLWKTNTPNSNSIYVHDRTFYMEVMRALSCFTVDKSHPLFYILL